MMTVLGIDIGGTKIAGGLIDATTGRVLHQSRVPTGALDGGVAVLVRSVGLACQVVAEGAARGLPAPLAVGVGAGGQIDPETGVVVSATDLLPGWAGTRLRDAFEQGLSLPASVDNDVNALAIGECRFGAGLGYHDLLYLALGTGVGGAIFSNARLHHGVNGGGGELGHLLLDPNGPLCSCGAHGCLEAYASGGALAAAYRAAGGDQNREGPGITEQARTEEGNGPATTAIRQVGEKLGLGLVSLANLFAPERIIIGGGMSELGDLLLDPARAVLAERALPAVRHTPVVLAGLGADASLVGAASLALTTFSYVFEREAAQRDQDDTDDYLP
jgi:glucokinase